MIIKAYSDISDLTSGVVARRLTQNKLRRFKRFLAKRSIFLQNNPPMDELEKRFMRIILRIRTHHSCRNVSCDRGYQNCHFRSRLF